ncbi:MAG: hypothetical protein KA914_04860 [Ottowia sp.]|nr:hypothetical protein [Ottowia sp.]
MKVVACLLALLGSWAWVQATARSTSRWRGWPGAIAGALAIGLSVYLLRIHGHSIGVALALSLWVVTMGLPCVSWYQAERVRRARRPATPPTPSTAHHGPHIAATPPDL